MPVRERSEKSSSLKEMNSCLLLPPLITELFIQKCKSFSLVNDTHLSQLGSRPQIKNYLILVLLSDHLDFHWEKEMTNQSCNLIFPKGVILIIS